MNIKKYFGAAMCIIGSLGAALAIHPIALPLAFTGILLFVQGSEDKIIETTNNKINSVEILTLSVSETLSNQLNQSKNNFQPGHGPDGVRQLI